MQLAWLYVILVVQSRKTSWHSRFGLPLPDGYTVFIYNIKTRNLFSDFCLHFQQCSLIVTNDISNLSSNRLRSVQKYQTPVVGMDYVYSCLGRGVLLPVDEYKLDTSCLSAFSPALSLSSPRRDPLSHQGIVFHRQNCFREAHRHP